MSVAVPVAVSVAMSTADLSILSVPLLSEVSITMPSSTSPAAPTTAVRRVSPLPIPARSPMPQIREGDRDTAGDEPRWPQVW